MMGSHRLVIKLIISVINEKCIISDTCFLVVDKKGKERSCYLLNN